METGAIRVIFCKLFDPFMGQTNLWRFLFWDLSIKIPLESISNMAMQIGTPDEASLVVEGATLPGFKDILGFVPKFFIIYSIIVEEPYSESAIRAKGFKARLSFTKSS
jgi:hypothetical protein